MVFAMDGVRLQMEIVQIIFYLLFSVPIIF